MTTFLAVIVIIGILIVFIVSAEIIKKVKDVPDKTQVESKKSETGIQNYFTGFKDLVNKRTENAFGGVQHE